MYTNSDVFAWTAVFNDSSSQCGIQYSSIYCSMSQETTMNVYNIVCMTFLSFYIC